MSTATSDATRVRPSQGPRRRSPVQTGSAEPDETPRTFEGDFTIACVDCGASVFEWSTPELDRCWQCAEAADGQATGAQSLRLADGRQ